MGERFLCRVRRSSENGRSQVVGEAFLGDAVKIVGEAFLSKAVFVGDAFHLRESRLCG